MAQPQKEQEKQAVNETLVVENTSSRPYAYLVINVDNRRASQYRFIDPGTNECDAAEFEKSIDGNAVFAKLMDEETIKVLARKRSAGLSDVPPAEAKRIVEKTFSLELLRKWQSGETRQEVTLALLKRVDTVEKEFAKRDKKSTKEAA